jgi:transaldolase
MKIFIDSADVAKIKEAYSWGIIDGVTTNPSHVAKTGRKHLDVYREICDMVDGPISLETITLTAKEMAAEGRELAKMHKNVVVKIPLTREGLIAVKTLTSEGIRTNVTVTFSPLQAMLAAKCGATYVSPFVGRLDAIGQFGMDCVRQMRTIYDNYDYKTQILTAAVRHPVHVLEAALAGSDVVTMAFDVIEQLYYHPLTDIGIDIFLKDWAKVPKP